MSLKSTSGNRTGAQKGRGATVNLEGRFERVAREAFDDGWDTPAEDNPSRPKTLVIEEHAKSIVSSNDSPDLPFSLSINPYRGCEHGCVYCYARPTHAYLGLSPGLDFETRIYAKVNAVELLRQELARPGYRPSVINIGANTDGYQPCERKLQLTRGILQVLAECNQPVGIITKNAMVERDIDIIAPMAQKGLAHVTISVTSLDNDIARTMEPRCSAPARRLQAIRTLADAGIPVAVNVAPIVPFLTDHEIERILQAAHDAGAQDAGYTIVRLPWEVKDIFKQWLLDRFPLKASHIMSRIHELRDGRDNDPNFGSRMHGSGVFGELIRTRFSNACNRLGLNRGGRWIIGQLDETQFRPPSVNGQLGLF